MFLGCHSFPGTTWRHLVNHLGATVDAGPIALFHFSFEPVRDVPMVHGYSEWTPNITVSYLVRRSLLVFFKELIIMSKSRFGIRPISSFPNISTRISPSTSSIGGTPSRLGGRKGCQEPLFVRSQRTPRRKRLMRHHPQIPAVNSNNGS